MREQYKYRVAKLRTYLYLIQGRVVRERCEAAVLEIVDPAEATFEAPSDDAAWTPIQPGASWGAKQSWAWFRARVDVPNTWPAGAIELRLKHEAKYLAPAGMDDTYPAGPEGQVFIDGRRAGAIDWAHHRIRFAFTPGGRHDVRAVFFAARCECRHVLGEFALAWIDLATEKLYHDLRVALDVVDQLPETSPAREKLIRAVDAAIHQLDTRGLAANATVPADLQRDPQGELIYASVPAAQAAFDAGLRDVSSAGEVPAVVCTGHAHIDLAWLWTIGQAKHKCVRTFATQVRLIDQYKGYVFQQSSAQAYAWMEQLAPDLFAQIHQRVRAGTWEAEGATWVEMDTNVVGGESLVRQLLYGKRYFREKLGVDSKLLWLPDVFGYSAALPQLLRLAGVEGFVTQKISWSQYNRFPHQSFRWRGIDGTEIPTHFPLNSYNYLTTGEPVREIKTSWDEYAHKELLLEPLMPFGWGDGGGGPTEEMLELLARLQAMPAVAGLPKVRMDAATSAVHFVIARAAELPVWDGELYLELHRGTYTSQAWIKRANRRNEVRLHQLEWLSSLAGREGYVLDKPRLDRLWRDLLLLQFHDILPGSSVGEVYDEVRPMHEHIAREADVMIADAADVLCQLIDTSNARRPIVLFNTLPWDRTGPVQLPDGSWRDGITVPAGGWRVIDGEHTARQAAAPTELSISRDGRQLSNRWWKLRLNDQGRIVELYDRVNDRRVLPIGAVANEWQVFEDRPMYFDAWDIDAYYEEHRLPGPRCESMEVVETEATRAAVEITWRMPRVGSGPDSTIVQRIALYADMPRIDFETRVDWHEHHQLLKVAFPVDVRATEATYEIQFGHLRRPTHRNTPWDLARFEVCGHRFVDVSEHGYGVALLNDCKYGHDVHDGVMRLTCIKSAQAPDARADQGMHVFTYALLPHAGSWQEAGVLRAAAELNVPLVVREYERPESGALPAQWSPMHCDSDAMVIDTLKPAEDDDGVILRLYESHGSHARATIRLAEPPRSVEAVNLLEEPVAGAAVEHANDEIRLSLRPFQIVSLRLRW